MSVASMERVRERIATTAPEDTALRTMLVLAHELLRQRALLEEAQARMPVAYEPALAADGGEAVADYGELTRRIHAIAAARLPRGARLLVVSRGDEALFPPDVIPSHFPQGSDGRYAGYYPADSDAAVAHLEQCRGDGAEFLLLPATAFWWLDYYGGFLRHLMGRGRVLHHDGLCVIFDLRMHAPGGQP
jgi:hypothetical protein